MTGGVIGRVVLGVWLGCVTVAAAQLPPEVQVDRHLVRVKRLLSEDKPWSALAELDKIITLKEKHNLTLPEDFHFKHAQVAFAAGRTESAIESVNKYLVAIGRNGEFYQEALELLDSAEEKFRRDEARRRRIEAERRRVEAVQQQNKALAQRQVEEAQMVLPRDRLKSGGLGPGMVRIASGRFQYFTLGARNLPWVEFDEAFAISKYEVTRGQFEQFVKSSRYRTEARSNPKHGCENGYKTVTEWYSRNSRRWNRPGFDQTDTHPVTCVSTRDAMAYAEWLSRETGHAYRLPSAAEWQYAFRAGSSSAMLYQSHKPDVEDPSVCRRGNLFDSSTGREYTVKCSDGVPHTAEVGRFMPNDVGLYDMVGNVSELVLACGHDTGNSVRLARDGSPEHPGNCSKYVIGLGSNWAGGGAVFWDYHRELIKAKPYRDAPDRYGDTRYYKNSRNSVGFRVVRDLKN